VSEPLAPPRALMLKRVNFLLDSIERHSAAEVSGFPFFSKEELSRRITQLVLKHYYTDLMEVEPEEPSSYVSDRYRMLLGTQLVLEKSKSMRMRVQRRLMFKNLFRFAGISTYLFFVLVGAFIMRRTTRGTGVAATIIGPHLVLDAFMASGDEGSRFARFCRQGPLSFLNEAELILCREEVDPAINESLVQVGGNPLVHVLKTNPPSISEVGRAGFDYLKLFVLFFRRCLRFPAFSFLYRDLAFFGTVSSLNQRGLIENYVISNSEYYDQELWLNDFPGKKFSSNMLWYSSGFEWYRYKGETEFVDSPENRFISVDRQWVWTARQKALFDKMPRMRSVTAVGPIMYYLPSAEAPDREDRTLAIFDLTPRQGWHFRQRFGEHIEYYNSAETVRSFMEEIVEQIEELEVRSNAPIRLLLKSKRTVLPKHEPTYQTYLRELEHTGRVERLHPKTNIFDLAKRVAGLIALPFTSPGDVGAYVGTPTLYYDPTGRLVQPVFDQEDLHFAQDRHALRRFLETVCLKT
jgi:hypothetical protein